MPALATFLGPRCPRPSSGAAPSGRAGSGDADRPRASRMPTAAPDRPTLLQRDAGSWPQPAQGRAPRSPLGGRAAGGSEERREGARPARRGAGGGRYLAEDEEPVGRQPDGGGDGAERAELQAGAAHRQLPAGGAVLAAPQRDGRPRRRAVPPLRHAAPPEPPNSRLERPARRGPARPHTSGSPRGGVAGAA